MKKLIAAAFLCLSLLTPSFAHGAEIAPSDLPVIQKILSLISESIGALSKLAAIKQGEVAGIAINTALSDSASSDCDNLNTICPVSPFGTRNEYEPVGPKSTVPQFALKSVGTNASLITLTYSISDIEDNQTSFWVNYGISPDALDSTTSPATVSLDITDRHTIDDANFLINVPSEDACMYVRPSEDETTGELLYNPEPLTYYFRFEAQNDLGTFFTPSLESAPFEISFDPLCADAITYYDNEGNQYDAAGIPIE